ncbi:MAG TPA: hypothetical protein VGP84_05350, partial [Gemmatimonadaceae bacterium]|nr:hypothetical protein [Gemmatimonadaceae bacterium]
MSTRRSFVTLSTALLLAVAGACHSKAPEVVPPPRPLSDSAAAALRWVDAHAVPISTVDSTRTAIDRMTFLTFVGNARVVGVSELVEGTHEFGAMIQMMLETLSTQGFRAIAIQAPMPE